ncbi:MAG: alpha/beta hydrolase [Capnocytophaga sp.]|nr:alpha/beta hydrolase [Capnocytophaga sp.]
MKKNALLSFVALLGANLQAQQKFKVNLDEVVNGTYQVSPKLPKDQMVKAGTILTIKAVPAQGYVFDSGYFTAGEPMPWGRLYFEQMTPEYKIVVNNNMDIGAYFVKKQEVENLNITQDIVYAQPGIKPLKYDVFAPKNAKNLPCVIIIHGGGWSSNTEDIMRGMAREIANSGKYVAFSIDYRWTGNLDGDATPTEVYQIIEDSYGAVLHIMENASKYGGDGTKLFITGDSAGGHLSASVGNFIERIGDKGFGKTAGVFEFSPTYLPKNKSLSQVKTELSQAIKGIVPTYGVFTAEMLSFRFKDYPYKNEIAPINYVPNASQRVLPQLLYRGTEDGLIKDSEVENYLNALTKAGQRAEYIQVGGANHAFFDWKPEAKTQAVFEKYGKYHIRQMLLFFDSVLGN